LALRPSLERLAFSHVFTSPRLRARRTCELAGLGAAAAVDADLAEWDYGAFEGVTSAAIHKDRPDWNIFRDGCPGGEQPGDVAARADRLIARLAGMGGNVAVFSHGQFGVVLAARWAELPVAAAEHFLLDTASLNILGYHPRHRQLRVIALWNARPGLR
jgi:probable phosphoglycerate mutase